MPTLIYKGTEFSLKPGMNVLGRDKTCDVCVPDPHISRRHLSIDVLPDGTLTVIDLGSTNGMVIDGNRVPSAVLQPGDEFTVGQSNFSIGD